MKVLLFALLSLFNLNVLADNKIETIQLNHRLASEVLSEIQPFLSEQATARTSNDFIILQATPKVIAEIKQLISKLDIPAQNITISVIKTDTSLSDNHRSEIDSNVYINEQRVSGDLSIRQWSTNNSRNKDQQYQVRGIAGRPVMISTTQSLPQKEQYLFLGPYGVQEVQTKITYIDIKNGFQAIANILPNHQVNVDIYPQFATFSKRNGVIDRSQVFSSISGRVGVWLEIGHIRNDKNKVKFGATSYQTHHQQQQFIYIKIDEIISQ